MFNLIVAFDSTAWETDQIMRMDKDRFGEYSGHEGEQFKVNSVDSLAALDGTPTLLMYEIGSHAVNRDMIRYGKVGKITVTEKHITFRFEQEGIFTRSVIEEYENRLGLGKWESSRTHWAVKDGGIPSTMMAQLSTKCLIRTFHYDQRI